MPNVVHIVGAGINGLLCAYMFARQGWSVVVSDAGPIPNPTAASHGLHRLIHPWSKTAQADVTATTKAALHMWHEILGDIGCAGFSKTGVLVVVKDRPVINDTEVWQIDAEQVVRTYPQFRTKPQTGAVIFPSFGVLWASKILRALIRHLSASGVRFRPTSPVTSVCPSLGQANFDQGPALEADLVIIAAGCGLPSLLRRSPDLCQSLDTLKLEIVRCFVVYGTNSLLNEGVAHAPAWASLGAGDLWGMPALRGHPAKFGCGNLSETVGAADLPWDKAAIKARVIGHYAKRFPAMAHISNATVACNHWVRNNSKVPIKHIGRCSVILSDNGSGFKFAPCVAHEMVEFATSGASPLETAPQSIREHCPELEQQNPSNTAYD